MKRWMVLSSAVVMVTAAATQGAQATAADIGAVTVAWSSAEHAAVRVTWTETTPVANTIQRHVGQQTTQIGTTTADGPNELIVSVATLGHLDQTWPSTIIVQDPAGGSATSPEFDTFVPRVIPQPFITDDHHVRWTLTPPSDDTPHDPLDIDGGTKYDVRLLEQSPAGSCNVVQLSDSTETTGLIPRRAKPYEIRSSGHNEWGTEPASPHDHMVIGTTAIALTVPASTPYGATATLPAKLQTSLPREADSKCAVQPIDTWVIATLEARNTPTSAWYVVDRCNTSPVGPCPFTVRNYGDREYRIITDDQRSGPSAYGGSSSAKPLRAITRLKSAKFITPTIRYGTKAQASLWVDPGGTQRATLQFRNASGAWQRVGYQTLSAGKGTLQFSWNRRGVTKFRWSIPASTSHGLRVEALDTGMFALTVR